MSKTTAGFVVLILVIFLSSIAYIWKTDAEKRELETTLHTQQEKIIKLEDKLTQLDTPEESSKTGEVQGVSTTTGKIVGSVITGKNKPEVLLVCVQETHNKQETCLDNLIKTQANKYQFEFELPQGTYEVYALTPPSETKVFYSEVAQCDINEGCTSNNKQKRLIQVISEETQQDINLYLQVSK